MLSYFVMLALGIIGVSQLRQGLLILQRRHDRREMLYTTIISNEGEQCKRFERVG